MGVGERDREGGWERERENMSEMPVSESDIVAECIIQSACLYQLYRKQMREQSLGTNPCVQVLRHVL